MPYFNTRKYEKAEAYPIYYPTQHVTQCFSPITKIYNPIVPQSCIPVKYNTPSMNYYYAHERASRSSERSFCCDYIKMPMKLNKQHCRSLSAPRRTYANNCYEKNKLPTSIIIQNITHPVVAQPIHTTQIINSSPNTSKNINLEQSKTLINYGKVNGSLPSRTNVSECSKKVDSAKKNKILYSPPLNLYINTQNIVKQPEKINFQNAFCNANSKKKNVHEATTNICHETVMNSNNTHESKIQSSKKTNTNNFLQSSEIICKNSGNQTDEFTAKKNDHALVRNIVSEILRQMPVEKSSHENLNEAQNLEKSKITTEAEIPLKDGTDKVLLDTENFSIVPEEKQALTIQKEEIQIEEINDEKPIKKNVNDSAIEHDKECTQNSFYMSKDNIQQIYLQPSYYQIPVPTCIPIQEGKICENSDIKHRVCYVQSIPPSLHIPISFISIPNLDKALNRQFEPVPTNSKNLSNSDLSSNFINIEEKNNEEYQVFKCNEKVDQNKKGCSEKHIQREMKPNSTFIIKTNENKTDTLDTVESEKANMIKVEESDILPKLTSQKIEKNLKEKAAISDYFEKEEKKSDEKCDMFQQSRRQTKIGNLFNSGFILDDNVQKNKSVTHVENKNNDSISWVDIDAALSLMAASNPSSVTANGELDQHVEMDEKKIQQSLDITKSEYEKLMSSMPQIEEHPEIAQLMASAELRIENIQASELSKTGELSKSWIESEKVAGGDVILELERYLELKLGEGDSPKLWYKVNAAVEFYKSQLSDANEQLINIKESVHHPAEEEYKDSIDYYNELIFELQKKLDVAINAKNKLLGAHDIDLIDKMLSTEKANLQHYKDTLDLSIQKLTEIERQYLKGDISLRQKVRSCRENIRSLQSQIKDSVSTIHSLETRIIMYNDALKC